MPELVLRLKSALRRRSVCSSKSSKSSRKSSGSVPPSPGLPQSPANAVSRSAADTVLKTPELLEIILDNLDQYELLAAQRVCRHWQEVVGSSLPMRRRLYLSPILKVDDRIPVDNMWLKSRFPDLGVYLMTGNPKWRPKFTQALRPSTADAAFFASGDASWRQMFLTQPPIKDIMVYARIEEPDMRPKANTLVSSLGDSENPVRQGPSMEEMMQASVVIRTRTGITMGMIVDASVEAEKRGASLIRKRLQDRKDSGYVSLDDGFQDEVEVAVVEVET